MRSRYTNQSGTEAFFNEFDSAFSANKAGTNIGQATQGDYTDATDDDGTVGFGSTGVQRGTNPAILEGTASDAVQLRIHWVKVWQLATLRHSETAAMATSTRWHSPSRRSPLPLSPVL